MDRSTLGRKQLISNADWLNAIANIEQLVTKDELELLTAITIDEIRKHTAGKKTAYAWSGGKDSLVLGDICIKAGVEDCMIGLCNLEYPAFLHWVESHKPNTCTVINTRQDLEWLAKHPEMLFPQNSQLAARWFSIVQHAAQRKYYRENNLEVLLLGRRRADGNYVGKQSNTYTDSKGITRYSPLADWKHEHILAYLHYYKIPMPPIYGWKNGYKCGTHPWPARQHTETTENGWDEVFAIEPALAEAKAYLGGVR